LILNTDIEIIQSLLPADMRSGSRNQKEIAAGKFPGGMRSRPCDDRISTLALNSRIFPKPHNLFLRGNHLAGGGTDDIPASIETFVN
jgi:hypothetical protein